MKTFLYTLATLVACAMAQDINSLPACEQTCIKNMLSEGPNYGCPNTDNGSPSPACLCSKPAFAYGVRDCSTESCPDGTDINQVSEYGLEYCQSAQASASGTTLAAIALFSSAASSATGSSASGSSDASATSSSSASVSSSAVSTVPIVSTVTSGGSTSETTIGSSTVFSEQSASSTSSGSESSSGSATAVSTSAIVSTVSDSSTTRTTTVGSTTISSASSEGAGPTMGPPRLLPRFGGQQADIKDPFWIVRALAYTGMMMLAVQLAWVYGGAW